MSQLRLSIACITRRGCREPPGQAGDLIRSVVKQISKPLKVEDKNLAAAFPSQTHSHVKKKFHFASLFSSTSFIPWQTDQGVSAFLGTDTWLFARLHRSQWILPKEGFSQPAMP